MAWIGVVLLTDALPCPWDPWRQVGYGILTWLVLIALLRRESPLVRAQTLVVVFSSALRDYVSHVLPALGVTKVQVRTFHDWAAGHSRRLFPKLPRHVREDTPALVQRLKLHPGLLVALDEWGREVAEHDGFGRFRFGIPPKTKGDLAFVQHMVATLNAHGKMGVVMPHGVLFRGASEGEIRKGLLQEDLIETVVGLPTNLFYGTGIPAAILVINRDKPKARKGNVLFVDASRGFGAGINQNLLRREDVQLIVETVRAFETVPRYARIVDSAEIEKNDWNLNISRYVETAEAAKEVDVASAIATLRARTSD
jgi:hypothetical protein